MLNENLYPEGNQVIKFSELIILFDEDTNKEDFVCADIDTKRFRLLEPKTLK